MNLRLGSVHANTLKVRHTASLLLTGLLILGIGIAGHHYRPSLSGTAGAFLQAAQPVVQGFAENPAIQAVTETASEVQDIATSVVAPTPEAVTRVVDLGEGRTFARLLLDAAISSDDALAASAALNDVFDHRKLKAGQEVTLSITRLGEQQTLTAVTFEPEPTKEVSITRQANGTYTAQIRNTPIERQRVASRGEIKGSLYAAGERAGVPRGIMAALVRAYSHEVDFQRDIHAGDKFEVLYDQPTARDGSPIGQGVIIYAALIINDAPKPLYRVTFGDGVVDYFDEKGQSVKRSLLRTPVEGARMTSGFGMRMHPLLGYSKMHKGVDFGAPSGTPIFAAGSGIVEMAKFNGSYGRFVRLRHNSKTQTAYAHMSRFAKGIYPGARVNQGDVIGFVGTSGRSTGPHLHYEVIVGGNQMNPLSVSMPVGRVLEGKTLSQFKQGQNKIKQEFRDLLGKKDGAGTQQSKATPPAAASIKVAAK
ncbi:MAG: peptidoglycan DD-metalloendopeptidase family protein [Alphaproteobacteria bacterium]|nr:peptidoglycan DD-metalloendopeptidase family protein [Alphaproteobacteria bacterium]